MKTSVILIASLVGFTGVAHAEGEASEGDPDAEVQKFTISADVALGTYIDTKYKDPTTMTDMTGTATQMSYFLGMRGIVFDGRKRTPLGHTPGIYLDLDIGWTTAASKNEGTELLDAGGGGFLMNMKMGGPWRLLHGDHYNVGAGLGFSFGMQMGLPNGTGRVMDFIAADAFVMAITEMKLGGLKTLFEGEYAAGAGYNEQRAYGKVGFGKLALGGLITVGQADINYFQVGVNIGYAFEKVKE